MRAGMSSGGDLMRMDHPIARRLGIIILFCLLSLTALIALSAPASAHAQLDGSDPAPNDVVATAPQRVTLTFGESVEVSSDSIQVFDDHLKRVDQGSVTAIGTGHNRIQVALRSNLSRGTYVVSWHVSSADTHPVSGTYRFSFGVQTIVSGKVPGVGRNNTAGFLLGVMRDLGYLGLILGPGVLLIVIGLWPAGLADPRTRRLLFIGLGLLVFSALGSTLLQGVWASNRGISAIWSAPSSLNTHSRRFDFLYALRFYLLIVFGACLFGVLSARAKVIERPAPVNLSGRTKAPVKAVGRTKAPVKSANRYTSRFARPVMAGAAVVSTLGLMTTWTLAGHAAAGLQTPIAEAADLLHLGAMSVWLGGLAVLTFSLRPAARASDLLAVLPRFSRVAFTCVLVLVITGSYQAWREVGTLGALTHTTFGLLLLSKIAVVLVVVCLGNLARRWVQRNLTSSRGPRLAPPQPEPVSTPPARGGLLIKELPTLESVPISTRGLQRGLLAESGIALGVLAITAALVVSVPGRDSYVKPYQHTESADNLTLSVRVDAPRVGDTVMHLKVRTATGQPAALTTVRGSVTQRAAGVGPLPLRLLTPSGATNTGNEDVGITFPRSGLWTLQLTLQTSAFDAAVFSLVVPVK